MVEDLSQSGPNDTHCEVDYSTGAIKFGDGKNGKIPTAGNNIYATYSVKRDGFITVSKAIKDTTAKINKIEGTKHTANVIRVMKRSALSIRWRRKMRNSGMTE